MIIIDYMYNIYMIIIIFLVVSFKPVLFFGYSHVASIA